MGSTGLFQRGVVVVVVSTAVAANGKHVVVAAANQGNLGERKAQDLGKAALAAFCPSNDS